jgi:hypothetical protein
VRRRALGGDLVSGSAQWPLHIVWGTTLPLWPLVCCVWLEQCRVGLEVCGVYGALSVEKGQINGRV